MYAALLKYRRGSPPRVRGKVMRCSICQRGSGITPAYAGKSHWLFWTFLSERDHPRVCGEKDKGKDGQYHDRGSPPRMRGKGVVHVLVSEIFRITPAYAGKSGDYLFLLHGRRDHPRVCGEKRTILDDSVVLLGSPPRMRGKGQQIQGSWQAGGITPAYAGKRCCHVIFRQNAKDHPRVCGEKKIEPLRVTPSLGSPPRMRGKGL